MGRWNKLARRRKYTIKLKRKGYKMLGKLFTGALEYTSQAVGELAHQTGKVYDIVIDEVVELKDAVVNSTDTITKGYDEELFSSDAQVAPKEAETHSTIEVVDNGDNTESTVVDGDVVTTVQKPKFV